MPDVARTTADLLALFPDNTTGDVSAQDARDFIKSLGCWDVAAGRTPTFSSSPNASYPGTVSVNGVSAVALLTSADLSASPNSFHASQDTGWRAVDISGTVLTATIDFGAGKKAEVVQGILTGVVVTGNQVFHPVSVKFEYSDDNSSYTDFGTPLTSMDDDAVNGKSYACLIEAGPQAARYWRLAVGEPSPGSGDNWMMLRRWRLFGRVI